jgi:predicted translin family RNA/ssDNA-binding protein
MEDPFKLLIFIPARDNLIKFHDEREQVIRLCRDINSYSKKLIFSCHRITTNQIDTSIKKQIDDYLKILAEKLLQINDVTESCNFANYKSTISNAIEEMIEGFTFLFYITNEKLLTYQQLLSIVDRLIRKSWNSCVELFVDQHSNDIIRSEFIFEGDYFMGIFDLTGEIMRYSISNLIDDDTKSINPVVIKNLQFLQSINRNLSDLFLIYPNLNINKGQFNTGFNSKGCGTIKKKMEVLKQSLDKVQTTVCDISIRSQEFPGNCNVEERL